MNAIVLPSGGNDIKRRTQHSNSYEESTGQIEARLCDPRACIVKFPPIIDKLYCPLQTNYCDFSTSPYNMEIKVVCTKYKGWEVLFVRSTWYYICWVVVLFVLLLSFSSAGHHAMRYPISRCFPMLNDWITEHLLQTEIQSRNLIRDEYDQAIRLRRRTEGWISGYSIKTKIFAKVYATATETDLENDTNAGTEETLGRPRDHSENEGCDSMCTICLLELEDGDRVADLSCGHLYHADCLSEWILKKNSCPLCQNSDIAKEIRTFESSDDDSNISESQPNSRMNRWRREAYDRCVDIATGRSRRRGTNALQQQLHEHGLRLLIQGQRQEQEPQPRQEGVGLQLQPEQQPQQLARLERL